ncbi:MAG TPA: hypothetical protein VEB22_02345 [Phycisphaerales bacterium]|nr:hypothetical protein [Phycisphaerales bacterium]
MKNTMRTLVASLALVAAAGLAACANHEKTAAADTKMETKAVNTKCPFSGGEAKQEITSTCHGQTVAFCCGGCKAKFDKMDHAKQHEVMAKATGH